MTTNAAFVKALQDMRVSDVKRHYAEPPTSVNTADMPCAFPLLPSGERGELLTTCIADAKTRRMVYVILVGPVVQSTQAANYGALAAHMDNLETALDALTIPAGGTIGQRIDYSITTRGDLLVGDTDFWAVEADLTIRDAF